MIRSSLKTFLLMFVAVVFALGSMAEAAPKKSVKTRVKHSSRVSTGAAASKASAKKKVNAKSKKVKKAPKKAGASTAARTKPR